jgi:hypothetical protein
MNRAWIPAGALAGVSVAGLIALGPLTSLDTAVPFPTSIPISQAGKPSKGAVPVNYSVPGPSGTTATAALRGGRGGQAAASSPTSSDTGYVGYRREVTTRQTPAKVVVTTPAKPKKVVKRPTSIGTTGEMNSSSGLAGGSNSSTSHGEQAATPSSATP